MEHQAVEGIEMGQSARATRHVVVAGDVTIDWNLARSGEQSAYAYWSSGRQTKAVWAKFPKTDRQGEPPIPRPQPEALHAGLTELVPGADAPPVAIPE